MKMRRSPLIPRLALLSLGLLAFVFALPVAAADDLLIRQWSDDAHQWERKDRDDLAADLWNKVLVLDPNNGDALISLGLLEARAGHTARARELLARALRLQSQPRGISRLGSALGAQIAEPVSREASPGVGFASGVSEPSSRTSGAQDAAREPAVAVTEGESSRKRTSSKRSKSKKNALAAAGAEAAAPELAPAPAVNVQASAVSSSSAPASQAQPAPPPEQPRAREAAASTRAARRAPAPAAPDGAEVLSARLQSAGVAATSQRTARAATAARTSIAMPADLAPAPGFQPDAIPPALDAAGGGSAGGLSPGKPRPCTPYPPETPV